MKLIYIADHHYIRSKDGKVFVPSIYGYKYWKKYLNVFENITIIGRGNEINEVNVENVNSLLRADGPNVEFRLISDFVGGKEYIRKYLEIQKEMQLLIRDCDIAIVRLPSAISPMAVKYLKKYKKIFACEMVSDPSDMEANNIMELIAKHYMTNHCKDACRNANGIAYVTRRYFQRKYKVKRNNNTIEAIYSDVEIPRRYFVDKKKIIYGLHPKITLLHVSNIIQGVEKGHFECVDILARLIERKIDCNLVFVGETKDNTSLFEYIKYKEVGKYIIFKGHIPDPEEIRSEYLKADFFVFPSHREGVPRVIIEAMACGLVCLASDVGGIPELLKREFLFSIGDISGYVNKILHLINNPDKMYQHKIENLVLSHDFEESKIQKYRDNFYSKLKRNVIKGDFNDN